MRVVVTGGAGFIGRAVVKHLVDRGDEVAALVRDPAKASHLPGERVTLVQSDLGDREQLARSMAGAGGVIHAAGSYRVGIKRSERPQMLDANLGTTERVLDAAIGAGVGRIVYVSTNGVFGNTNGVIVDETFRRDLKVGFLTYYDESKYLAHVAAEKRMAAGGPILIVQPSQVYGPNDHSDASAQLQAAYRGTLRYMALANVGLAWVHVDDLSQGILAALDRGRVGEIYSLAGPCHRQREAVAIAARVGGKRAPRLTVPTVLLKLMAPLNDALGGLPGSPSNLRETITSADNVTYWASHEKATRELGFEPRSLDQGVADTWGRV